MTNITNVKMTKRTRAIRKQKKQKPWGLILRKYGLYADLDKVWDLGVRSLDDIRWMTQEDIILSNLKGTLAEYRNMFKMEMVLEGAAKAAP